MIGLVASRMNDDIQTETPNIEQAAPDVEQAKRVTDIDELIEKIEPPKAALVRGKE